MLFVPPVVIYHDPCHGYDAWMTLPQHLPSIDMIFVLHCSTIFDKIFVHRFDWDDTISGALHAARAPPPPRAARFTPACPSRLRGLHGRMCHRGTCLTDSVLHHVAGKFSLVPARVHSGSQARADLGHKDGLVAGQVPEVHWLAGDTRKSARTRACRRVPGAIVVVQVA